MIFFLIGTEGISITENMHYLGVPVPKFLSDRFECFLLVEMLMRLVGVKGWTYKQDVTWPIGKMLTCSLASISMPVVELDMKH
ncbi:hypothetical protein CEW92_16450 [Bacillaceae bacterium SAS-127]|nr:hypothetical protein CEW92_16450 [Bacillaceae bacterium SAS-127]